MCRYLSKYNIVIGNNDYGREKGFSRISIIPLLDVKNIQ